MNKELIKDFEFKKKFGQNFLYDENILRNIVDKSEVDKDTLVIEIGVGAAFLTYYLTEKAKYVVGYEIDESLKEIIEKQLENKNNIKILFADFLKRNVMDDIKDLDYKKIFVVANLPYYITTPIITKFIEDKIPVDKIVVMVQKEVAQRLSAKQGSSDGGSFSLFLQYYMETEYLFDVPREKFLPAPKVTSAVLRCVRRPKPAVEVADEAFFFRVMRGAFLLRRKTLANSLSAALSEFDKEAIQEAIIACGFTPSVRGEQLTLQDFANLSAYLKTIKK